MIVISFFFVSLIEDKKILLSYLLFVGNFNTRKGRPKFINGFIFIEKIYQIKIIPIILSNLN